MKFRHVNPHNVEWLVPAWAISPAQFARSLDDALGSYYSAYPRKRWDERQDFWIEIHPHGDGMGLHLKVPDETGGDQDRGYVFIYSNDWVINLPLNEMLKGAGRADRQHCVYQHTFDVDCPLAYIGVTKQRWFDRLAQHESSARNGSPYLFHRAIREHAGRRAMHRVIFASVDEVTAMTLEQEFVERFGLYPLGLNMIPGGYAGIRYLHKLGVAAANPEQRDAALEAATRRESIEGRPNPLCAARWEADADFAARVICGHSGRLTTDQVREIRRLAAVGRDHADIAARVNDREERVRRVLSGARYGRIA